MNGAQGRYVPLVSGPHWVIEAGAGRPLVLLHGGLDSSDAFSASIGTPLSATRRVVAFDRAGHGRTADTDGPYHYADMAGETAALIETLGVGPVDLCGWSDGGIVALFVALERPELVRRAVLIGANFRHEVMDEALLDPDAAWLEPVAERYAAQSPDGVGHFPEVVRKTFALWVSEPALTVTDLGRIHRPILVLNGDRDSLIPLDHTVRMFEAIPNAQLAIVPGASHFLPAERPALTAGLIANFLDAPEPFG
jgi:pimeloyl-ACP methyl ester carboxylesterase